MRGACVDKDATAWQGINWQAFYPVSARMHWLYGISIFTQSHGQPAMMGYLCDDAASCSLDTG